MDELDEKAKQAQDQQQPLSPNLDAAVIALAEALGQSLAQRDHAAELSRRAEEGGSEEA
ncbi:MAG TPA: hypothetical protein VF194_18645 [Ferrovibrio sp.]|jgi:hypothetical protein|uniref:hypothetical protein n=1 Tax=Ferrovibrio sp. TaxID=1917215 RepID=UPI002ED1C4EA